MHQNSEFIKRGRIEITANILELSVRGSGKTRLMYGSTTSFPQLKRYLKNLGEHGLLECEIIDGHEIYRATDKGKEFLEKYDELMVYLQKDDKDGGKKI